MCGGTPFGFFAYQPLEGLSPRVRGNPVRPFHPALAARSIPACAGEPYPPRPHPSSGWVYPRVCGGTVRGQSRVGIRTGLSPRVRGNHGRTAPVLQHERSIPACAGEPPAASREGRARWVYPRVCGGTRFLVWLMRPPRGLSPRVRGNLCRADRHDEHLGSIPACAGEPRSSGHNPSYERVYPRVCGGTSQTGFQMSGRPGLSPRVRGNPGEIAHGDSRQGSIPACAGEPRAIRQAWC